jgi:hypothetical protein
MRGVTEAVWMRLLWYPERGHWPMGVARIDDPIFAAGVAAKMGSSSV